MLECDGAELRCRETFESPIERTNRSAGCGDDNCFVRRLETIYEYERNI